MVGRRGVSRRTARRTSRRVNRRADMRAERAAAAEGGAAPEPEPSGPDNSDDRYEQLKKVAELHQQGILSDEEFAAEKAKILDS